MKRLSADTLSIGNDRRRASHPCAGHEAILGTLGAVVAFQRTALAGSGIVLAVVGQDNDAVAEGVKPLNKPQHAAVRVQVDGWSESFLERRS